MESTLTDQISYFACSIKVTSYFCISVFMKESQRSDKEDGREGGRTQDERVL